MAQPPTFCGANTVYTTSKFSVVEEQFSLPNGKVLSRPAIKHAGAVVILPLRSDGSVLFVRQYRYPLQQEILELPAGTLDRSLEHPLECAKRELSEEIGCTSEQWSPLGFIYSAPGFCSEVLHCFLAANLHQGTSHPEEGELIETAALTLAQIKAAIASGELSDAKSICAIYRAELMGVLK